MEKADFPIVKDGIVRFGVLQSASVDLTKAKTRTRPDSTITHSKKRQLLHLMF